MNYRQPLRSAIQANRRGRRQWRPLPPETTAGPVGTTDNNEEETLMDTTETPAVSEAASRKPGRPRLIPSEAAAILEQMAPVGLRAMQDHWHGFAADELREFPEFGWLFEGPARNGDRTRVGILAQLGRMFADDGFSDQELVMIARDLCRMKLSSKASVSWMRSVRLAGRDRGAVRSLTSVQVTERLRKLCNDLLACYPRTAWAELQQGAWGLVRLLEEQAADPTPIQPKLTEGAPKSE